MLLIPFESSAGETSPGVKVLPALKYPGLAPERESGVPGLMRGTGDGKGEPKGEPCTPDASVYRGESGELSVMLCERSVQCEMLWVFQDGQCLFHRVLITWH